MATFKELSEKIEILQKEAEQARQNEIAHAKADIKAKMKEYGITIADLGLSGNKNPAKVKGTVAAKFRDSVSGATWSGRGKPPRWIAGKDRNGFLIK